MTKEFFEQVMRVPTCSGSEDMMQDFLMEWAKSHSCKARKDGKGNVYITKGSAKWYPCLGNHIDTVHVDQRDLVKEGKFKEIVWKGDRVEAVNPLTGKTTGLGMDDQGGCAIALAVIDRLPAAKGIFVVEEEVGMQGSRQADKSFFDDCAFIISNDSPDRNRATHYSSGVQLYSDEFFKEYLEPICKKHGVTRFNSEPYTDVKVYRSLDMKDGKHIECFNFGNGGYDPHRDSEYASFGDVNAAEELLYALCTGIPCDKQYTSDIQEEPRPQQSGGYGSYGGYGTVGGFGQSGKYSQGDQRSQFSAGKPKAKKGKYDFDGHDFTDVGTFEWIFRSDGVCRKFVQKASSLIGRSVKVEKTDDLTVRITGELRDLRRAYMIAFNYDNDKEYRSWVDFIAHEKNAETEFQVAVQFEGDEQEEDEPKSKMEHSDSDEAVVSIGFEDQAGVKRFVDVLQNFDVQVEADADGDDVTVQGRLGAVKHAWVLAHDIINGTKHRFWPVYAKEDEDGAVDFWDAVMFDDEIFGDEGKDDVIDVTPEPIGDEDDLPPDDEDDPDSIWSMFR